MEEQTKEILWESINKSEILEYEEKVNLYKSMVRNSELHKSLEKR